MGRRVIDIESWKRKKSFDFFVNLHNPVISVTANVTVDSCYRVAKANKRSFFICYCYAIMRALNEIEEFRYRIVRQGDKLEVSCYDSVDLVSPIAISDDGGFRELKVEYNPNFDAFYAAAEQIFSAASQDMNPIVFQDPDSTFAVISAMPFLHFTSMTQTQTERGGVNQPTLINVGKMIESNGSKIMPIALSVHHGLVDGFHIGKFFSTVQSTLDSM